MPELQDGGDDHESSSSSSASSSTAGGAKKRKRLPAPTWLGGLAADPPHDDPSAHGGRKRRVAHVDGNYATWIFAPVAPSAAWRRCAAHCAARLRSLAEQRCGGPGGGEVGGGAAAEVQLTEEHGGGAALGWHVSLAPMLSLRRQFIGPFVAELGRVVASSAALEGLSPLFFDDEVWVLASKDFGRFFAGPLLAAASAALLRPVAEGLLGAACEFGLLQEAPSVASMRLHCSLAWTVADLRPALTAAGAERFESDWGVAWRLPSGAAAPGAGAGVADAAMSEVGDLQAAVGSLCVRVGERTTLLPLPRARRVGGPGGGGGGGGLLGGVYGGGGCSSEGDESDNEGAG
mmetsp:Transcript_1539/g.4542  ORF Transcript_1539/g.4542 Transcript_1539/m.4542 type:complete len:347 (-) Transcript_1539:92-1132(-)